MGVVQQITDGLQNVVANLGTGRDKQASSVYVDNCFSSYDLLTMYRNSWLAAAIVDYPAEDATRKWRSWRAESDQISSIEAEEKRLGLQHKVQEALIAARLYGGAALYINTGEARQERPLTRGTEINSLVVLTKDQLRPKSIVRDIDSPYYGAAEYYTLTTGEDAERIEIHASRLAIFPGNPVPGDYQQVSEAWGDSVLKSTYDAMLQADNTMANIASLVFEAKVDVFKFQGFADLLAQDKDDVILRRAHLQAAMKGINGAVVIDGEDDYQQKNAAFGGLPAVAETFQNNIAGAARIPVTRLYGRAAVGLSGSGDGDERVYYDRIGHEQSTVISPALEMIDESIIITALGSRPPEIYYEWAPLRQITESERAEIFSKTASAARAIAGTATGEIIPLDALSDSLVNELTELGVLPGLEQSIQEYGTLGEQSGFEGGQE